MDPNTDPLSSASCPRREPGIDPASTSAEDREANFRPLALATLTLTLIVVCVGLAYPVLPAITWGLALAILAYPMHRAIFRWLPWPGVAAGASTAVVVGVLLGTMAFVTYQLSKEARSAVQDAQARPDEGTLLDKAKKWPVVGRAIRWTEGAGLDIEKQAQERIEAAAGNAQALAQGSIAAVVQFLVAVFILFYLLKEPDTFLCGMREVLPLSTAESDRLFRRAGDSIHANLYATLVTSIIDTIGFGVLFWWAGFPAWILWTVVMFILSLLPILGSGVVWVPAVGYLASMGKWGPAGAVLAWGAFTFVAIDNALYARIAGDRMKLHEVPALIAFLGGLSLFGMSGIILGPLALALAVGLLDVWKARRAAAATARFTI